MKEIEALLRTSIRDMRPLPYASQDRWLLPLDQNTNLMGPNPVVRKALAKWDGDLTQYPTHSAIPLRNALGRYWKVEPDQVIVGNGSDEVFDILCKTFLNPGERAAYVSPGFVMYGWYARINAATPVAVPLRPDFSLDVPALLRARAKMIFLCNPNNPTANLFDRADILRILGETKGLVVLDEAYADFSASDWTPELRNHRNLVLVRTFSKAFGLAGLRVGYAMAHRDLAVRMAAVKPPFNVGGIDERIAVAALADPSFRDRTVRTVLAERPKVAKALRALRIHVFPSDANFLLLRTPFPAGDVVEAFRKVDILVRDMAKYARLDNCIRVTVGPPAVNRMFLRTFEEILQVFAAYHRR